MDHILSLRFEIAEIQSQCTQMLIASDLNIHHKKWLRYSHSNSQEGVFLKSICDDAGLIQIVREPTRENYFFDLCLTDMEFCKVSVHPSIADHKLLMMSLKIPVPESKEVEREVWHCMRGEV